MLLLSRVRVSISPWLLLLSFLPGALAAQDKVYTADIYKDWVKRCASEGTFKDRCYISQQLSLNDTGEPLFNITVGYPLNEKQPLVLVSTPLGVYLPAGVEMKVDDLEPHRIVFAYCNTEGCHGYYRMPAKLVTEFKQGRWLRVTFLDGTRRGHQFDVSLNGFTASLKSLESSK